MMKFLFSLNGRVSRSEYWLKFVVPYIVIYFIAIGLDIGLGNVSAENPQGVPVFTVIFLLVSLWPSIALPVKRIHDRGRTGWFYLVMFIPILNLWPLVEILFLKGTDGSNDYGEDPLG